MIDFSAWPKVVVELGMGDGRLIESLAKNEVNSLFIGIEIDREQCRQAQSRISSPNIVILNESFEKVIQTFPDKTIDQFVAVLPDPDFIDEKKRHRWDGFYMALLSKLKVGGTLQVVTEITDELLQPVSDEQYAKWTAWLCETFVSLGYHLKSIHDGAPPNYFTRCLDQFRGDPQRIRIVTLDLSIESKIL